MFLKSEMQNVGKEKGHILIVLLVFFTTGCTESQAQWWAKKLAAPEKTPGQNESEGSSKETTPVPESVTSPRVPASEALSPAKREELTFTLTDNTVIIGKSLQEEIPFNSPFGQLNVKAEDIASFKEGRLKLGDGTSLEGSFVLESLRIKSEFGEIEIKVSDIISITR